MPKTTRHFRRFLWTTTSLVAVLVLPWTVVTAQDVTNTNSDSNSNTSQVIGVPGSVADLNSQIEHSKQKIQELQQQSAQYQTKIESAATQVHDLKSQIGVIDDQIAQTNINIQAKQEEISTLELEMAALQQSIDEKTASIQDHKQHLSDALLQLDKDSRTSTLALVLTHGSLADFYSQAQATASLSQQLQDSLTQLQTLRQQLEGKQSQLASSRDTLKQEKAQLEVQKQSTVDQLTLKNNLLSSSQQSAAQYNDLLTQALQAEQQADATITALQAQLQAQIASGDIAQPQFSSSGFMWPITSRSISAYFHDPDYPFSCRVWKSSSCMEHSGLDIRTPQGTPVRAAASGYVSVVHDQGWLVNTAGQKISSALNYVAICHDENCNLSSRYLHLSAVYAHVGEVITQGAVIGLSGGLPGTAGAGGMTTGAHLHMEIRVNGFPDDPLKYLPGA